MCSDPTDTNEAAYAVAYNGGFNVDDPAYARTTTMELKVLNITSGEHFYTFYNYL